MRVLEDKDNELLWKGFHLAVDSDEVLLDGDLKEFDSCIDTLNTWHSHNIGEYIIRGENLGDYLKEFNKSLPYGNQYLYCAMQGSDMVATAYITAREYLVPKYALERYIQNIEVGEGVEYVTISDAEEILARDNGENAVDINYLIVNPQFQNQGVGTRVIRSITENLEYFTTAKDISTVMAFVHGRNIASQKAMLKNKFKKLVPSRYFNTEGYDTFFFTPREYEMQNNEK